jgi:hypothetical protein
MRYTKRDIAYISQRITWRETTALEQVRTARRCYDASKEDALCVLICPTSNAVTVGRIREHFLIALGGWVTHQRKTPGNLWGI